MKGNQKEKKYFTVVHNVVAAPCILKDTGEPSISVYIPEIILILLTLFRHSEFGLLQVIRILN